MLPVTLSPWLTILTYQEYRMGSKDWGLKRICHECRVPFYDLKKDPITCPKCNVEYDEEKAMAAQVPVADQINEPKKNTEDIVAQEPDEPIPYQEDDFIDILDDDLFDEERL